MQIALKDIRDCGYVKLSNKFFDNESKKDFFDRIVLLNSYNYNIKASAFGFLSKFVKINEHVPAYVGMSYFIRSINPLIDVNSVSDIDKRLFRDRYEYMWKRYCDTLGLDAAYKGVLENFGIRLFYLLKDDIDIPEDIVMFYNSILIWSTFMQSESNLECLGKDSNVIIKIMMKSSDVSFVDDFIVSLASA